MTKQPTIVITGTAGFIGSVMVQYLNENGLTDLLLVDDFGVEEKRKNWEQKTYTKVIERQAFLDQLINNEHEIDIIIHLGARTDTTEFNYAIHEELNWNIQNRFGNMRLQNKFHSFMHLLLPLMVVENMVMRIAILS